MRRYILCKGTGAVLGPSATAAAAFDVAAIAVTVTVTTDRGVYCAARDSGDVCGRDAAELGISSR